MKRVLLTLFVLALGACDRRPVTNLESATDGIIGGGPVAPSSPLAKSVVAIHGNDGIRGFLCTGVLITENKVLTAGHCAADLRQGLIVFSTDLSTRDPKSVRAVTGKLLQPRFIQAVASASKNLGDLAVLSFSGTVPAGYHPADIAGQDAVVDGETVLLAGYGLTDGHTETESQVLQAVAVRVKSAMYSEGEFTVDQSGAKGACHGDSGGPAFVAVGAKLYLVGITSRGMDDVCGTATIYTRVSGFLDWIKEAVRE